MENCGGARKLQRYRRTPLKEGFNLSELTEYILNIYYVLLSRGIDGCAVYFEDKM